jgi:hypothetical protein
MRPTFRLLAALAACAGLSGCLAGLGRPEGVLPAGDLAPPPPIAGTAAGRSIAAKTRSDSPPPAAAPAARPSRSLSVPTNVRGAGAISAPSERRIRREDLEDDGSGGSSRGGGGSLGPTLSPSGSVGVGGRF